MSDPIQQYLGVVPQTPIGHRLKRLLQQDLDSIGSVSCGWRQILQVRSWRWLSILANENKRFGPLLSVPDDAELN